MFLLYNFIYTNYFDVIDSKFPVVGPVVETVIIGVESLQTIVTDLTCLPTFDSKPKSSTVLILFNSVNAAVNFVAPAVSDDPAAVDTVEPIVIVYELSFSSAPVDEYAVAASVHNALNF